MRRHSPFAPESNRPARPTGRATCEPTRDAASNRRFAAEGDHQIAERRRLETPTQQTTDEIYRALSGDLYQSPDPLAPAPPGTLIWAEQVDDLPLDPPATVWRILYHSRSQDDRDIAVSGFAIVPTAPVPSWRPAGLRLGHGTVGLGDQCAPSHEIRENLPPYGGHQLEQGAVLVATDYEGLGTSGVPTSTVALGEGHAVLDSIRSRLWRTTWRHRRTAGLSSSGRSGCTPDTPISTSATLQARYCTLGAAATRRVYPGEGHDGVIDAAADDAMTFITDRYEHQAATSTC